MKKSLIYVLIGAFLIAVIVWCGYVFFYKKISTTSTKVDEVMISVARLEKDQERIIDVKKSVDRTEANRKFVDARFYSEESLPLLLETIEGYAKEKNVAIEITELGETQKGLEITLHAEGGFSSLVNFIALLEQGPFEIHMDKLFFSKIPQAPITQNPDPKAKPLPPAPSIWELNGTIIVLTYTAQ